MKVGLASLIDDQIYVLHRMASMLSLPSSLQAIFPGMLIAAEQTLAHGLRDSIVSSCVVRQGQSPCRPGSC